MRRFALLVGACALLHSAEARAQRAVTVRADNDAFNFWQYPWSRPDEEYTSGVRLTVALDGAAPWARRIEMWLGACHDAAAPCASQEYTVGQDIFTAARPRDIPTAPPGARPDAGVLWFSATTRVTREKDFSEAGWTIGVTGEPSLAEPTQHFFHTLAPSYNRPIVWGRELPAEPVFSVQFDRRRRLTAGAMELQPHAGASLGTLLTEARAGIGARVGRDGPRAWRSSSRVGAFTVEFSGDATLRAVVRNEVLSGTFFRPSARMTLRPFVTELAGGTRVRWRDLEASWMAHQTSAEYAARGAPHVWSTLELSWRPSR